MSDIAGDLKKVLEKLEELVTEVESLQQQAGGGFDGDEGGDGDDDGGAVQAAAAGSGSGGQQQGVPWPGEVTLDLGSHDSNLQAAMTRVIGVKDLLPMPGLSEPGLQIWRPRSVTAHRPLSAAVVVRDLSGLDHLPERLRMLEEASPAEQIFVVARGSDATVRGAVNETLGAQTGLLKGVEIRGLGE